MSTVATPVTSTTKSNEVKNPMISINEETAKLMQLAYDSQDDIENQTRFNHKFLFDAVQARVKYTAQAAINKFENEVTKLTKLHPAWSREKAVEEILVSKAGRNLQELAHKAGKLMDAIAK